MVDVIIPVYNVSLYLRQCINSILNQTYKNLNIIIVDDGSTDGSSSICDEYSQYNNITVIHQKNIGLSGARNKGLTLLKGEYIMFVDSDDWIEPNTIETLLTAQKKYSAEIVCCKFFFEYKEKTIRTCNNDGKIKIYNQEEALRDLFNKHSIGYAAWGKLYKRDIFEQIEFPIGKIHEDIPITPKLFLKCKCIIAINKALVHYRQQEGSLSRDNYKKAHHSLYEFSVLNRYIVDIYPSLRDAYYASHFVFCKDLLTLFKNKEQKKMYADYYTLYRKELTHNILKILNNKSLNIKSKLLILSILLPFRKLLKKVIKS